MTWTSDKPIKAGWYFYRQPAHNLNKPLSALVHAIETTLYVSMFAPHEFTTRILEGQVKDFHGEWFGPVEVPK